MTNDCKIHISGLWKRNMIYELTGIGLILFHFNFDFIFIFILKKVFRELRCV